MTQRSWGTAVFGAGLLVGVLGAGTQLVIPAAQQALAAAPLICATPGLDGPGGLLGGVVNTYYPGRPNASAGDTSISVGGPTGAGTRIGGGDLLLVIQMQGASINSTNTTSYGDGVPGDPASGWTMLNGAGQYEYVTATGPVTAGVVPIAGSGSGGGLLGTYTTAPATATQGQKAFQVVRTPQYSSVTLGSSLTASPWNGSDGGVLALDVAGSTNLGSATVSVDSLGFRGGAGIQNTGSLIPTGTDYRNLSTYAAHGQKGEGLAGTPAQVWDSVAGAVVATGQLSDGYPSGSSARGAPGTAGGGGTDPDPRANDQNSGGGGGGNGGTGGLGGNSWSSNLVEGGFGGTAYPASATQLTLGGGGGAGTRNNSAGGASSGGTGGGMVLIRTGLVSGTGTFTADGGTGPAPTNDGGGGGGAGGSVLFAAANGTLSGLTVHADGGAGADAWPTQPPGTNGANAHGPGGGGGGGAVVTSSVPGGQTVAGGLSGTATTAQLAYNAQPGDRGVTSTADVGASHGVMAGSVCRPVLSAIKTTSTPAVVQTTSGATAAFTVSVTNASRQGTALAAQISDPLPSGFSYASTSGLTLSGGAMRTATVNPAAGDTTPVFGTFSIPGGGSVAVAFTANIASSVAPGTYRNTGTGAYADPQRTSPTGTLSVASAPVTVNIIAPGTATPPNNPTPRVPTPPTPSTGLGLLDRLALALPLLLGGGLLLLRRSRRRERGHPQAG